ncbi:MAG: hypothetical protein EOO75_20725 [Myxococcales bacterium]|nr:MAG: hypothetical protein EOO75_20725 [Myxococcales bacterium]
MRYPLKVTENFLLEPVLYSFGVRGETSHATIADGELEVQMGTWLHERIPLTEITRLSPATWPWWGGMGIKLAQHGVGLIGAFEGIVNVQLQAPRKVRVVLDADCSQVWLSLDDPDGFLRELSQATGVTTSELTPF